jgi:hypothetical protein
MISGRYAGFERKGFDVSTFASRREARARNSDRGGEGVVRHLSKTAGVHTQCKIGDSVVISWLICSCVEFDVNEESDRCSGQTRKSARVNVWFDYRKSSRYGLSRKY